MEKDNLKSFTKYEYHKLSMSASEFIIHYYPKMYYRINKYSKDPDHLIMQEAKKSGWVNSCSLYLEEIVKGDEYFLSINKIDEETWLRRNSKPVDLDKTLFLEDIEEMAISHGFKGDADSISIYAHKIDGVEIPLSKDELKQLLPAEFFTILKEYIINHPKDHGMIRKRNYSLSINVTINGNDIVVNSFEDPYIELYFNKKNIYCKDMVFIEMDSNPPNYEFLQKHFENKYIVVAYKKPLSSKKNNVVNIWKMR